MAHVRSVRAPRLPPSRALAAAQFHALRPAHVRFDPMRRCLRCPPPSLIQSNHLHSCPRRHAPRYTYLYTRMRRNPMVYGISWDTIRADPGLKEECRALVEKAARVLDDCRMVRHFFCALSDFFCLLPSLFFYSSFFFLFTHQLRYDSRSGLLACTDLGRVASHYYICHATIGVWNKMLRAHLSDSELLHVVCSAQEFEQLKVREEEAAELMILERDFCPVAIHRATLRSQGREGFGDGMTAAEIRSIGSGGGGAVALGTRVRGGGKAQGRRHGDGGAGALASGLKVRCSFLLLVHSFVCAISFVCSSIHFFCLFT